MGLDNNSVRVAVRIRPQGTREKAEQARICTSVVPGIPQIVIGGEKSFTYDHVFDQHINQVSIYTECVKELVEGIFDGYNATVLAYGQTGSGKTYTMGSSFDSSFSYVGENVGIIPRAAAHLFDGINQRREEAKEKGLAEPLFEVQVQFIELYNEEIIDLLTEDRRNGPIKIHEDPERNEIYLKGVTNVALSSADDVMEALRNGALHRTTAATNMNQQSSRSHAIFTVMVKQQRMVAVEGEDAKNLSINGKAAPATEVEVLMAKFHFVDLAGSERLKRTGATGDRAKEGISINSGLLALGNVISALGGGSGRVQHVPYRDSKLTRLLQDSLGGNSRTLMIACASPSDIDFVETLNTLNYANRAKNIKNKVVANQDKSSKLIGELRGRIAALEAELNEYRQGKKLMGDDGQEMVNDQYLENVSLQHENNRLNTRVKALTETIDILRARSIQLQEELATAKIGGLVGTDGADSGTDEKASISSSIRIYLQELEELRVKMIELRSTNDELRKQNARFRAQIESGTAASPYILKSANNTTMIIKEAKKEIKRQKRLISAQAKKVSNDENVEPAAGGEESEGDGGPVTCVMEQIDEDDEENEEMAANDEEESSESDEEETEEAVITKERDRLCSDLAFLQEDISIKEKLVAELEEKDRRLAQIRHDYERKLGELSSRISTMEAERDRILHEMTSKSNGNKHSEEKIRQVKDDYEKRLGSLRGEFKKYKSIEVEHRRMQVQQNKQRDEMRRIQHDILEMKKNKVELMKRLKEENKRAREAERNNMKRLAGMEKITRQQENQIRMLKMQADQRAEAYKRKAEEVQKLRDKQRSAGRRPNSQQSSRQALDSYGHRTPVRSVVNAALPPYAANRLVSSVLDDTIILKKVSPMRAKKQWSNIEKVLSRLVTKRQTVSKMEEEMNRQMSERFNLLEECKKLENIATAKLPETERRAIDEQKQSVQEKLNYVSERIMTLQSEIADMDFTKDDGAANAMADDEMEDGTSTLDETKCVQSLVEQCNNITEAKYLLDRMLNALLEKGEAAAKAEYEKKELNARIQQMERDARNRVISQLLVEADDVLHDAAAEDDKTEADDARKQATRRRLRNKSPSLNEKPVVRMRRYDSASSGVVLTTDKARRKTATTEELLYAAASTSSVVGDDGGEQNTGTVSSGPYATRDVTETLKPIVEMNHTFTSTSAMIAKKESNDDGLPTLPMDNYQQLMKQSTHSSQLDIEDGQHSQTSSMALSVNATARPVATGETTSGGSGGRERKSRSPEILDWEETNNDTNLRLLKRTHYAKGHSREVNCVHANETYMLSGSRDRTAILWDLERAVSVLKMRNHYNNVNFVRLLPESRHIAITGSLHVAKVWDLRAGECVRHLFASGVYSEGENWPVARTNEHPPSETLIYDCAIDPAGKFLFTTFNSSIRVWNLENFTNATVLSGNHSEDVSCLDVSGTSSAIIRVVSGSRDNSVGVCDFNPHTGMCSARGALIPTFKGTVSAVCCFNGSVYSASRDLDMMHFSLLDFKREQVFPTAHPKSVAAMCVMPTGQYNATLGRADAFLVTVCRGGTIRLWEIGRSNRLLLSESISEAHNNGMKDVCSNSQLVFTAADDGTIGFWRNQVVAARP